MDFKLILFSGMVAAVVYYCLRGRFTSSPAYKDHRRRALTAGGRLAQGVFVVNLILGELFFGKGEKPCQGGGDADTAHGLLLEKVKWASSDCLGGAISPDGKLVFRSTTTNGKNAAEAARAAKRRGDEERVTNKEELREVAVEDELRHCITKLCRSGYGRYALLQGGMSTDSVRAAFKWAIKYNLMITRYESYESPRTMEDEYRDLHRDGDIVALMGVDQDYGTYMPFQDP